MHASSQTSRRGASRPKGEGPSRQGLHRRDPGALADFYDLYFQRTYAYVRRVVTDEHTAEDITHDIFVHVYTALPNYDPSRDIRPWLYTIASNKLRDHWRSRPRQEALRVASVEDGAAGHLHAHEEDPDARMQRAELAQAVRRAVDRLPEGMRETVKLRLYEGLSFEAVGKRLGRNVTAVRKRYSRALRSLHGTMAEADPQLAKSF